MDLENLQKLVGVIHEMNRRGENPATSGNYSYRLDSGEAYMVSESSVDKSRFQIDNFLKVFSDGSLSEEDRVKGRRSSAETDLHLMIFRLFPQAKCVLHSHGLSPLVFVEKLEGEEFVHIENMEMLKTLNGIQTHQTRVRIPLCENSQNMKDIISSVENNLKLPQVAPAFIIRRHGLYTWGESVDEAWRHLEALNYLFAYEIEKQKIA